MASRFALITKSCLPLQLHWTQVLAHQQICTREDRRRYSVTVLSFAQPCFSDSQNIDAIFRDMFTDKYSVSCNRSGINQMQTDGFICYVPVVVVRRYLNQVMLIYTSKLSALLEFMPPSTHCLDMSKEYAFSFCFSSEVNILSLTEQMIFEKHISRSTYHCKAIQNDINSSNKTLSKTK